MIQSYFSRFDGAEAKGFSESQFHLQVQALHDPRVVLLLGSEPVQDQLPVLPQAARCLLHRVQPAPHRLPAPGIQELAGEKITATYTKAPGNNEPIGGIKIVADSGWFALRPSGTEDVYKIYAESFRSEDHLRQIQAEAQAAAAKAFRL